MDRQSGLRHAINLCQTDRHCSRPPSSDLRPLSPLFLVASYCCHLTAIANGRPFFSPISCSRHLLRFGSDIRVRRRLVLTISCSYMGNKMPLLFPLHPIFTRVCCTLCTYPTNIFSCRCTVTGNAYFGK